MLERKIYRELLKWKADKNHSALLLDGARQTGKTFILEEFGRNEYETYVYINFIERPDDCLLFSGNIDVDALIKAFQLLTGKTLPPGKTLIFLDEIQECPRARASLKFFASDGRYDVVASGSLLGVRLKTSPSSPVGYERRMTLRSMDFEEFLWAMGVEKETTDHVRKCLRERTPLGPVHNVMMSRFREYMLVGGMPKVVQTYVDTDDLTVADDEKEGIMAMYRSDIAKYNGSEKEAVKTQRCFDSIPSQLSSSNNNFVFAAVDDTDEARNGRNASRKYSSNLLWIHDAGYGIFCHNLNQPKVPLKDNAMKNTYRVYLHDTGMLMHMYEGKDRLALYTADPHANLGHVYENAVAECLVKCGYNPYYFRKSKDKEHGNTTIELDFVFYLGIDLAAVEVKSGNDTEAKSLEKAKSIYGVPRRIMLWNRDLEIDGDIERYPIYAAAFMDELERDAGL